MALVLFAWLVHDWPILNLNSNGFCYLTYYTHTWPIYFSWLNLSFLIWWINRSIWSRLGQIQDPKVLYDYFDGSWTFQNEYRVRIGHVSNIEIAWHLISIKYSKTMSNFKTPPCVYELCWPSGSPKDLMSNTTMPFVAFNA